MWKLDTLQKRRQMKQYTAQELKLTRKGHEGIVKITEEIYARMNEHLQSAEDFVNTELTDEDVARLSEDTKHTVYWGPNHNNRAFGLKWGELKIVIPCGDGYELQFVYPKAVLNI